MLFFALKMLFSIEREEHSGGRLLLFAPNVLFTAPKVLLSAGIGRFALERGEHF